MPPKKLTPKGTAAKPAGDGVIATRKAPVKKAAVARKPASPVKKFIRNVRGVNVRVTFDSGRRVQLEPRGQRGDMSAVSKDELDDPIFLSNLGLLYEIISGADAEEIRAKQFTNASTHPNRPEALLTNQLGENITSSGVDKSFESQGRVIATLHETVGDTPREQKSTQITRGMNPERSDVPGSSDNSYLSKYDSVSIDTLPPISERE